MPTAKVTDVNFDGKWSYKPEIQT